MQSNMDLYTLAEQKNITVDTVKLPKNESMSACLYGREFILIDEKVKTDSIEERVHLAHEIGHCATGAYYAIGANKIVRDKAEEQAKRWAVLHLIPKDEFEELLREGNNEWDIAEYYGVTIDFVRKAYHLYFEIDLCA